MFEKNLKLSYLLDFYGEVLDEHTRNIMKAYYNDDLSLAEIAVGEEISRQGVRHIIKKGTDRLESLENKLGLASHYIDLSTVAKLISEVSEYLQSFEEKEAHNAREKLDSAVNIITKRLT